MINVIAQFETTLVSGISAAATTGTLESNASADNDGATIPNGDYGIVIDENNSRREYAVITLNGFDFTFVKRGISLIDGSTEKTGNVFAHRKGAVIKIVNHPVLALMVNIFNGLAPLTGILYNDAARSYTSDFQLVDKKYVDDVAIAGGAKASETVYGISKLSSAAADPTQPTVLNSEEVSATTGANKVVRVNASGKIDKGFLEVTADKGLIFSTNALEVKPGTCILVNSGGVNVDVGTTANKIVQLDANSKLPAVDGSQLTNLVTNVKYATASATLQVSLDTERNSPANSTPTLLKKVITSIGGVLRISFDLKSSTVDSSPSGRIYKNGTPYGTPRSSNSLSYTTFSEDLFFYPGDVIELYGIGTINPAAAYVRNFRFYYTEVIPTHSVDSITD